MTSLINISAQTKEVHGVAVRGLSVRAIAALLVDFPAVAKMMTGRDVEQADMIFMAPDAVAHVIAAGVGQPGDKELIAEIVDWPLETTADFFTEIMSLTMPTGVQNFMEKVTKMLGGLGGGAVSSQAPETSLQKPSND